MENGLPIKSFYDDKSDNELEKMSEVLENLSYVNDVRYYIKEIISLNQVDYTRSKLVFEEFKNNSNKNSNISNNNINIIKSINPDDEDEKIENFSTTKLQNKNYISNLNYENMAEKLANRNNLKILHVEKIGFNKPKKSINIIYTKNFNNKNSTSSNSQKDLRYNKRILTDINKDRSLMKNSYMNISNTNTTKNSIKTDFFKKNPPSREGSFKNHSFKINDSLRDKILEKKRNYSTNSVSNLDFDKRLNLNNNNFSSNLNLKNSSGKLNIKTTELIKRPASVTNSTTNLKTKHFNLKNPVNTKPIYKYNNVSQYNSSNNINENNKTNNIEKPKDNLNKKNQRNDNINEQEKIININNQKIIQENLNYFSEEKKILNLKDINQNNNPDTNIINSVLYKELNKLNLKSQNNNNYFNNYNQISKTIIKIKKIDQPRHSFNAMDLKKLVLNETNSKMNFFSKNFLPTPVTVRNVSSSQNINKNFLTQKQENLNNKININHTKHFSTNTIEKFEDFLKINSSTSTARNTKNSKFYFNETCNKTNYNNSSNNSTEKYSSLLNKREKDQINLKSKIKLFYFNFL